VGSTSCVQKRQQTASKFAAFSEGVTGVNDANRLIGTGALSAVCYPFHSEKRGLLTQLIEVMEYCTGASASPLNRTCWKIPIHQRGIKAIPHKSIPVLFAQQQMRVQVKRTNYYYLPKHLPLSKSSGVHKFSLGSS